jgi:hypothetical protein
MLRRISALATIAFLGVLVSTGAMAAAQRTFVAYYGNDGNPCSLTLPCRAFAAAIAQTYYNGEVIVLDSAGYGPVTIAQSMSIIAPPGVYAGISVLSGFNGVTIDTPGVAVVLRGLSIIGLGGLNGISFLRGASLTVERCTITNMGDNGMNVRAPQSTTTIFDTEIANAANSGVYADAFNGLPMSVEIVRSRFERNQWGIFARQGSRITARDTSFIGHSQYAALALTDNGTSLETQISIDGTTFDGNVADVAAISANGAGRTYVSVARSTFNVSVANSLVVSSITQSGGIISTVNLYANTFGPNAAFNVDGNSAFVYFFGANTTTSGYSLNSANDGLYFSSGNNYIGGGFNPCCNIVPGN